MNTLTIAILEVCATAAYASALPGKTAIEDSPNVETAVLSEELLQGDESKWRGGGGGYYRGGGGGYHGGWNRGGGGYHGGWNHGGGGGHHGGYHRGGGRGWGK